ncbi:hypothetical protein Tco_1524000 [Tanacetum coccineum]
MLVSLIFIPESRSDLKTLAYPQIAVHPVFQIQKILQDILRYMLVSPSLSMDDSVSEPIPVEKIPHPVTPPANSCGFQESDTLPDDSSIFPEALIPIETRVFVSDTDDRMEVGVTGVDTDDILPVIPDPGCSGGLSDISEDLGFIEDDIGAPTSVKGTPYVDSSFGKHRSPPEASSLLARTRSVAQYIKKKSTATPCTDRKFWIC